MGRVSKKPGRKIVTAPEAAEPVPEAAAVAPADLEKHYAALLKSVRNKLTLDVMLVTPQQATEWLARNKGNRPLGSPTVDRYAGYMTAGEWVVNGEAVILDDEENLLDGQHRLEAVIRSGVAVPMLVVYGVPAAVFPTLNTGKTRCLADVLAIKGEKNQRTLAGALRLVYHYRTNTLGGARGKRPGGASLLALADFLRQHPQLEASVEFVAGRCKRGVHPPGAVAFLHYEMSQRHPDLADKFFTTMLTQTNIPPGGVESRLNDWLHDNHGLTATQPGLILYLAVWTKAWNILVRGGTCTNTMQLMWRKGNNEPFPIIL